MTGIATTAYLRRKGLCGCPRLVRNQLKISGLTVNLRLMSVGCKCLSRTLALVPVYSILVPAYSRLKTSTAAQWI